MLILLNASANPIFYCYRLAEIRKAVFKLLQRMSNFCRPDITERTAVHNPRQFLVNDYSFKGAAEDIILIRIMNREMHCKG